MDDPTAEEQYRQLATEARVEAHAETDLYKKRQLQLSAQHYEVMADRAKHSVEARRSRKRKTA